jgi:hypothetical protein
MFYTKSKLPGGRTVKIELTDENVFTNCSECGCELPLALTDEFMPDILCSRCEEKKMKLRPTFDGIAWLASILARSGFAVEVIGLYDQFDIDDLADLAPWEYAEFGDALARIFMDA